MKTAIVYRSNKDLTNALTKFKNHVDLYLSIPSTTKSENIKFDRLMDITETIEEEGDEFDMKYSSYELLICDLTVLKCLPRDFRGKVIVIKQDVGVHEDYILEIAQEAQEKNMDVVIFRNCLAHHCTLKGIDPYQIGTDRDGWYLDLVLKTWSKLLQKQGVAFQIVANDIPEKEICGKIIVCDHHNGQCSSMVYELHQQGILISKDAHRSCKEANTILNIDDIPILFGNE